MLFIRSLLSDILLYSSMAVIGILGAPLALWSRDGAYWVIKTYCKTAFWILKILCNLRVEYRGEFPKGDVIVCSKHMSFLDVLMLANALPRAKFIMKNELKWAPVLGFYAWRIGASPVSRGKKGAAMKQMISNVETGKKTEQGQLAIYPQGTRVLPGAKKRYKVGAAVLYNKFGVPCVPAATNTGVFWARRSPYRKPGTAIMEFLEPIPAGMPVKEFLAKIEEVIETNSDRLMAEAGFKFPESSSE